MTADGLKNDRELPISLFVKTAPLYSYIKDTKKGPRPIVVALNMIDYAAEFDHFYFYIGQDSIDRGLGDELNDLLEYDAFDSLWWMSPYFNTHKDHIRAFYSSEENAIFLCVNGYSEEATLQKTFVEGNITHTLFEELAINESAYLRDLHFIFLVAHLIVFIEPVTRFDLSLARTLKAVNKIRLVARDEIIDEMSNLLSNIEESSDKKEKDRGWSKAGRIASPRLLFAFHRNNIKGELGHSKKREIYDKLEQSLEDQIFAILQCYKVVENGYGASLGYVKDQFVHLINPNLISYNPLSSLLNIVMDLPSRTFEEESKRNSNSSFIKFLRSNMERVREDEIHVHAIPPLITQLISMDNLLKLTSMEGVGVADSCINKMINKEVDMMNMLRKIHVEDAANLYLKAGDRDRQVFTKAEHDQRFAAAVAYLDRVIVGNREEAMDKLRCFCDLKWKGGMRGCEQQSLTGNICQLPAHSCIGDISVGENTWKMHYNDITYISTCSCGKSQTLRRDPFTLREANYDFLMLNRAFKCCEQLERYSFALADDEETTTEKDDSVWMATEDQQSWVPGQSNTVLSTSTATTNKEEEEKEVDADDIEDEDNDDTEEEDEKTKSAVSSSEDIQSDSQSTASEDEYRSSRSYLKAGDKVTVNSTYNRDENKKEFELIMEYQKKISELKHKNISYVEGVPHSLSPSINPLFPSFVLTCIGPSSIYSHSMGLRDQPNFKIGCEYLLPVDVSLTVDGDRWDSDMQYVHSVEGVPSPLYQTRHRRMRRGISGDIEKVKLFVGFDYECPRGHRFFVSQTGQPLLLPKGHAARESECRNASIGILDVDLPLRRQCTCRKLPHQAAQLMRIHVVTPKAPVNITIHPIIQIPSQEGYFHTGEQPLELSWAKYYILQLPFIYSSPLGVWIPPPTLDSIGIFKGKSINVSYKPLNKW